MTKFLIIKLCKICQKSFYFSENILCMFVCSTAGISYDLNIILKWMDKLDVESFEFMINPESKWNLNLVAQKLKDYDIKSVHGNRDIAKLILNDRKEGIKTLEENLEFMHKINANFLVLHAWDPRSAFNIEDFLFWKITETL